MKPRPAFLLRAHAIAPLILCTALGLFGTPAQAIDIGISAQELHQRLQQDDSHLLFIDIRDPVEIMFTGFTDEIHANVPFLLVDRNAWSMSSGSYRFERNPDFVDAIRAELKRRGLPDDTEIVTMCRSGSARGEPSAALLRANGFANARYLVDGFQGEATRTGPHAGQRLNNGWQNSGLPWSTRMNPLKMYRPQERQP